MVNMRVRKKNIINIALCTGKLGIFKHINTLLHTIVNQNPFAACFQAVTASGYLVIRPDKMKSHIKFCPLKTLKFSNLTS
jgi:hypothetical protein